MQRLMRGLVASTVVCVIAVIGYWLMGWSWADSLYMVVITIFSIGYGEVRPIDTPALRVWTMLTIVFGYIAALFVISGLAQMVVDGQLRKLMGVRRMMNEIGKLRGHIIICGYGRMGRGLGLQLKERRRNVLVIDRDEQRIAEAVDDGFLAIRGNATDEEILTAAGIEHASTLASVVEEDAANLFITISARGLNPDLQIFSRGEHASSARKLRQVGADHVVLTAAIGASRLSQLILRPSAAAMLENEELPMGLIEDLESIGLSIEELIQPAESPLAGESLLKLREAAKHSFLVVAIRQRAGNVVVNPPGDALLNAGESVLVLGHDEDIRQLCSQYDLYREKIEEKEA